MPLTHCRDNSEYEYGTAMTCTQTIPETIQILCKCKESSSGSQSNEYNGTLANVRCKSTNCINRMNGANESDHVINGVETEVLTKTRYISQQSTVV